MLRLAFAILLFTLAPAVLAKTSLYVHVVDERGEILANAVVIDPQHQVPALGSDGRPVLVQETHLSEDAVRALKRGGEVTLWVEAPGFWPRTVTHTIEEPHGHLTVPLAADVDGTYQHEGWRLALDKRLRGDSGSTVPASRWSGAE
ncbi:MAG: hypothetical protein EP330_19720 [Deltaproteobacteria bacterium]|nr:MAG: hypothetical protein EP330_19720 [Deltaproteobacteria bacterium]